MLVISTHFSASAPWRPNDLPNAIKQLKDQELELLLSAVLAEKKRRGKRYSDSNVKAAYISDGSRRFPFP
jgi:hypothetical protein